MFSTQTNKSESGMSHIGEEPAMNLPFDDNKDSALMEDQ